MMKCSVLFAFSLLLLASPFVASARDAVVVVSAHPDDIARFRELMLEPVSDRRR